MVFASVLVTASVFLDSVSVLALKSVTAFKVDLVLALELVFKFFESDFELVFELVTELDFELALEIVLGLVLGMALGLAPGTPPLLRVLCGFPDYILMLDLLESRRLPDKRNRNWPW